MKLRTVWLMVALVWSVAWVGEASAQDTPARKQVTVATYNLLNLFDVFDDPYTQDESTRVKPADELAEVARVLRHLDADVVAFQELENEGVLAALVREHLGDMGYRYVSASLTNSTRGIRLGLISRLPIVSQTSHRFTELRLPDDSRTWRFARDLTRFELRVGESQSLDLYVVHFKSKRDSANDPQSGKWRLAEATAARRIIEKRRRDKPTNWTMMVGDFNDTPDSAPIRHLLEAPADRPATLVDLHKGVSADQRVTYLRKPYRSTIDFILASPELAERVVPGSAKVVTDEALLGGSDHAPVVATFGVGP